MTKGGDSVRLFLKGKVTHDLGKSLCFVSGCHILGGNIYFVLRKF